MLLALADEIPSHTTAATAARIDDLEMERILVAPVDEALVADRGGTARSISTRLSGGRSRTPQTMQ